MSELLTFARDYIERMSNPVYGYSVNEDYATRFATLLRSEGFEKRLNQQIRGLRDRNTLTSYGWLWLLEWTKSRRIDLSEELLMDLFEEWSSVFVRCDIVDVGTHNADYPGSYVEDSSLTEFPNSFLARIMLRATRSPEERSRLDSKLAPEDHRAQANEPSTALAGSTLIALLQVGRPITLAAAAVLLRHKWEGQEQLLRLFWAICDSLDAETREAWIKRLSPPSQLRREG